MTDKPVPGSPDWLIGDDEKDDIRLAPDKTQVFVLYEEQMRRLEAEEKARVAKDKQRILDEWNKYMASQALNRRLMDQQVQLGRPPIETFKPWLFADNDDSPLDDERNIVGQIAAFTQTKRANVLWLVFLLVVVALSLSFAPLPANFIGIVAWTLLTVTVLGRK